MEVITEVVVMEEDGIEEEKFSKIIEKVELLINININVAEMLTILAGKLFIINLILLRGM